MSYVCKDCGQEYDTPQELGGHRKIHPKKGRQESNGTESRGFPPKAVQSIEEAAVLNFRPQSFTVNSTLIWQAKYVTETEWGWRKDLSVGDWLDTFLFEAFKAFGVILGGYVVVRKNGAKGTDEVGEEEEVPALTVEAAAETAESEEEADHAGA